ncbi:MAG: sugar phosphate nucleotidyltransferase [Bacteroidales bacterium]|nr:sugar phosphate nucleotidyltransferase [Bacteroidales bacterium]
MNKNYYAIIMAGGVGSRFWPMSRTSNPKQFIDILGTGSSLIRQSFDRLNKICPAENILVVTNEIYKDKVLEQIPEVGIENILCEPTRKNTAPCIAYATYKIMSRDASAKVIVAPSDHIILKEDVFLAVANNALEAAAKKDCLITLGITPSRPDTGYGYIQMEESAANRLDENILKVKTFTEKPNYEMALSFIESNEFVWNSGIFIWSVQSILSAFKKYLPEMDELFASGKSSFNTPLEKEFIKKIYPVCQNTSIDYGVMEKADNVFVYKTDFGWSDLGTWGSLFENSEKDNNNNVLKNVDVIDEEATNCIISSYKNKLVVVQGLEDYIVVDENDVLLICKKSEEQKIRQFVDEAKQRFGEKYV